MLDLSLSSPPERAARQGSGARSRPSADSTAGGQQLPPAYPQTQRHLEAAEEAAAVKARGLDGGNTCADAAPAGRNVSAHPQLRHDAERFVNTPEHPPEDSQVQEGCGVEG